MVAASGSTTSPEVALDTAPLPFLGAERHELVEELLQAFDEVANSGTPQWWSLEAPPGWGKTRCVQELFARLAAEWQEQPAYWPPELVQPAADGVQGGTEATRKRVAPDPAAVNKDATPVFFWWGISCLSRPGSTFEALVNDLDQFRRHEDGLERLREKGRAQVDEEALFRMVEQMRTITDTAQSATRKARRDAERHSRTGGAPPAKPAASPPPDDIPADGISSARAADAGPVAPFEVIEQW